MDNWFYAEAENGVSVKNRVYMNGDGITCLLPGHGIFLSIVIYRYSMRTPQYEQEQKKKSD